MNYVCVTWTFYVIRSRVRTRAFVINSNSYFYSVDCPEILCPWFYDYSFCHVSCSRTLKCSGIWIQRKWLSYLHKPLNKCNLWRFFFCLVTRSFEIYKYISFIESRKYKFISMTCKNRRITSIMIETHETVIK